MPLCEWPFKGISDNVQLARIGMVQTAVEDGLPEISIPKTQILLAELVKWFHISVVVFTGIGWALPWWQAWLDCLMA